MKNGTDSRPTGDRRSLASGGIQTVLDVALVTSEPGGKKMRQQRIARPYLPHGRRESNLGCAAYSRRAEDAWLRDFGAIGAALDTKSASQSRVGKMLGGVLEKLSRSIATMDFFTVPTMTFGVLYFFFVIAHARR
jgi:hypothetical protein